MSVKLYTYVYCLTAIIYCVSYERQVDVTCEVVRVSCTYNPVDVVQTYRNSDMRVIPQFRVACPVTIANLYFVNFHSYQSDILVIML